MAESTIAPARHLSVVLRGAARPGRGDLPVVRGEPDRCPRFAGPRCDRGGCPGARPAPDAAHPRRTGSCPGSAATPTTRTRPSRSPLPAPLDLPGPEVRAEMLRLEMAAKIADLTAEAGAMAADEALAAGATGDLAAARADILAQVDATAAADALVAHDTVPLGETADAAPTATDAATTPTDAASAVHGRGRDRDRRRGRRGVARLILDAPTGLSSGGDRPPSTARTVLSPEHDVRVGRSPAASGDESPLDAARRLVDRPAVGRRRGTGS